MKQTAFNHLAAVALAVLAMGCAAELKEKENLAAAAGFKVITRSASGGRTRPPNSQERP